MENVSIRISGYFQRLERSLDCPKPLRRSFLTQTRRMAEDYIQGNPDATWQELVDFLGEPEELAQGFLETLDPEVLERFQKRRNLFLVGLVAVLVIALVAVSCWAIHLWNVPTLIEATNVITIYE